MKVAESKNTTSASKLNDPFFQKNGNGFFPQEPVPQNFFSKKINKPSPAIQAKLTIGQPNDPYEKEADAMADKVVQRLSEPPSIQTKSAKCAECEKEEKLQKKDEEEPGLPKDKLQKKPIFESNEESIPEEKAIQKKNIIDKGQIVQENAEPSQNILNGNIQTKADSNSSLPANGNAVIKSSLNIPSSNTPSIQAKCASCEQEEKLQKEEEEETDLPKDKLQKKPVFESNEELPDDKKNIRKKNINNTTEIIQKKGEQQNAFNATVQAKAESNNDHSLNGNTVSQVQSTSSVTNIPLLQAKCTSSEQEEKLQKKEEETDLLKNKLQQKPVFESNEEPPDDKKNIRTKNINNGPEIVQRKTEQQQDTLNEEPKFKTDYSNYNTINRNAITQTILSSFGADSPAIQAKCASCEQEEKRQKKEEEETDLPKDKLQKKPVFESNEEPPDDKENIRKKNVNNGPEIVQRKTEQQDTLNEEPKYKTDYSNYNTVNGNTITQTILSSFGADSPAIQAKYAGCGQEEKLQKKEEEGIDLPKDKLQKKPVFANNEEPPDDEKNIQLKRAECEKEEKLQRKSDSSLQQTASPGIEASLSSSKGSGAPLPQSTREQMESSFGADFSSVRIHNDNSAAQMNKDLNAQAFTHGSDIYFNSGKYDSNSKSGNLLLAHELTHVVQQGGASSKKGSQLNNSHAISTVAPKIQRGIIDDLAKYLLTGNAVLDFIVGVVAGIFEWFGDLFEGIITLFKEAFDLNIGAIIAIIGIIVVIILAVCFPQVVVPILIGLGIVLGIISLIYFIYMMTRPGLTPYERGKYLGKALVEAVLLIFTIAEAARFVKTFAEVAKLTEGVGFLKKLSLVRQLLRFGKTAKVLEILSDIRDVEKTIELLNIVKDVDKALKLVELAEGAKGIDTLLEILKIGGVTADDVISLMGVTGMTLNDLKDFLKTPGMTVTDLKDLLGRPGMTVVDLKDLLKTPGMTVADLKDLLGRPGMTVADLKNFLKTPGMTVADLKDLLSRPGMTVADLKDLLSRPGMTVADLKDFLVHPGMTIPELKALLSLADDAPQLKRLLAMVPLIKDLKEYFRLAGGAGQGAKLESILKKATALGDFRRVEDLLNLAGGNKIKFAELVEALDKFGLRRAPGGTPVGLHGYSGINLRHFQARHTYEFFDFAGAVEPNPIKTANTLWPPGTDVIPKVEEALTLLDSQIPPKRLAPFQVPPEIVTLGDGSRVTIGKNHANIIGQFFPFGDPSRGILTFTGDEMRAFKKLLIP